MSGISMDQAHNTISEALDKLIRCARADSDGNLQNKNVLMEGFYREFLNILYGWKLINANVVQKNAPGIDLIDQENRIVAQVSATCNHEKIQKKSLDKLKNCIPTNDEDWHFYFIPITMNRPQRLSLTFNVPQGVIFNPKEDVLDGTTLLRKVDNPSSDADSEIRWRLVRFVQIEKALMWENLNGLLRRIRDNHPSFMLMKPDDIDRRLYPNIKAAVAPLSACGKISDDGTVCHVWDIIRESWRKTENHSIVIEGAGGIGKTVALFSVADAEDKYCPAPAVYVPIHKLTQYVDLSDFCCKQSETYGQKINELAEKPWDNGPQLLVLLDGFNEVPTVKQHKILNMLKEWHVRHPGAQYIAVSRHVDSVNLKEELTDKTIAIELEPIKEEVARAYMSERNVVPPPVGANVWKTLVYPLFLTLYAKTNGLKGKAVYGYPLAPKEPENGGALIWNYLQRELLRIENEEWVLDCAVACEFLLPFIAFRMEREHRFTIERKEAKTLIQEAMRDIDLERLPHHLKAIMEQYDDMNGDYPDLFSINWNNTVFHDVGLMQKDKNSLAFIHQHFRDALAGLYLVNRAEMMQDGDTMPEVWQRAASYEVMGYAAELMEEREAQRLWEANRVTKPTDKSATYAMMELQMRRWNNMSSNLDFSGMDLRGVSLVRYLRGKQHGERDMKLFRHSDLSVQTQLDEETFHSPGHTFTVTCVAMTEDGRCISGSLDGSLHMWDLRTGECLRMLDELDDGVTCVAMTEDGQCISGSLDGSLHMWDLNTGKCLCTLKGHANCVTCVAVTEDGQGISGSDDQTIRVWDLNTGECLRTLEGHAASITCVAVTENGRCVSGSFDKTLRVWDLRKGECLHTLDELAGGVTCVSMTEDGQCISGSLDGSLHMWDLNTGKCLRALKGHAGCVTCVAVTENGQGISGSDDRTIRVWDLNTGECLRTLEGHTDNITCVAVAGHGQCVSGAWDRTLRVWDLITGKCSRILEGHVGWVKCVAVTGDGLCVSGSGDGNLRVWDLRYGKCLRILEGHTGWVNSVSVTEDRRCVSGSSDGTLLVWDLNTGKSIIKLEGHAGSVNCVVMIEDKRCVSGSSDETLRVWDLNTGECLRTLEGHTGSVNRIAVSEDRWCISESFDDTLRVWDLNTGECLRTLEGHTSWVRCIAATEDGRCVSEDSYSTLRVWDLNTGKYLRTLEGHAAPVTCVAVTEDERCVSGSHDETLRIWDLNTGECQRTLEGHTGWVNSIAVTEDGLCISGSSDETLRVWEMDTGKCLDILRSTEIDVSGMDFSEAALTPKLARTLWQNRAKVREEGGQG